MCSMILFLVKCQWELQQKVPITRRPLSPLSKTAESDNGSSPSITYENCDVQQEPTLTSKNCVEPSLMAAVVPKESLWPGDRFQILKGLPMLMRVLTQSTLEYRLKMQITLQSKLQISKRPVCPPRELQQQILISTRPPSLLQKQQREMFHHLP